MRHIIWRNRASAILGLFVVIIPFTGFPEALRDALIVLLGVLIVIFGFYRGSANYALVGEESKIDFKGDEATEKIEVKIESRPKKRWGQKIKTVAVAVEENKPTEDSQ